MKKAIKIMSLMLAVLMCLFAFTACGGGKKDERETIVVGYTIYEPMNYKDANGKLIGFDTELAEKVFNNLGYKVVFKEIKWANKYIELNSNTIDCIWNGFTCNSADDDGILRSTKVDFSYNYMENLQVVVAKKDSGITDAASLNKKIAVAEGGSAGESYAKKFEGISFKSATVQIDALTEVNSGNADFAVVDAQLANSYCGKGNYTNLAIVDALTSDVEYYAVGFKKGSALTQKVNEQFEKLGKDGTIKALGEKYKVATSVIVDFESQKDAEK